MQRRELVLGLTSATAALVMCLVLWRFTVDDALIVARYAANLRAGHGYCFNRGGPSTDGVTPLGLVHLLSLFAANGPWAAYRAAKVVGLVVWLFGAFALGATIAWVEPRSPRRYLGLLLLVSSAPLA